MRNGQCYAQRQKKEKEEDQDQNQKQNQNQDQNQAEQEHADPDEESETEQESDTETELQPQAKQVSSVPLASGRLIGTHIRTEPDPESGEQTDTQSTDSNSSTPTTADVADEEDVETVSSLPLSPPTCVRSGVGQLVKGNSPLKRLHADNRSASIATTTTTSTSISTTPSSGINQPDLDNVPTSSRYAAHPSNFVETAITSSSLGTSSRTGGGGAPGSTHRRTHSAASYISMWSLAPGADPPLQRRKRNRFSRWLRYACNICCCKSSGIGEPSVHHALVVIFLEFFAWGLLTMPIISKLNKTFPDHTFLMNGLVMGIKGILSFLAAPLIGALSDIWGRKFFLLVTVFFTCLPIPVMSFNTSWFFAMISISGAFAVTFSVVFAYVADVTTPEERSKAYGLASATFAASLVISPALGNALMDAYGETLVIALSTAIALLDVFFILVAVPESLSEKVRPSSWGAPISWEQADPFQALRKVGTDKTVLMLCLTVLLSYLPEAGEYSCMFVYLKLKMGFNYTEVSIFIAIVGILSITVQVTLGSFMKVFGAKRTIIVGLALEIVQLLWYGLGSQKWMMWSAGVVAALASITYPAISAFVSLYASPESQGAVQGMITGMRGLCNGLGPAVFGVFFYLFNVNLNEERDNLHMASGSRETNVEKISHHVPGPPFLFGALCVVCAIIVASFIPEGQNAQLEKKRASLDVQYEIESGHKAPSSLAPLIRSDSLAQL
ncbi:hippocampus abundant transcript 1 protein isoform X1 [Drosophila miranda]|uniref:hippocampus abundant transcript 1 protein isoform X1 n=1 Tax=Drosophila miranda TaxID=7229 RepID=UPI0007E7558D|nr:hippocampus abundant transcript 1 protein isoform X1 [Drosophila miranda]XP_033242766.1 hippocampus abundant transcript 1 protein isoform X1 [Drosophila miranda]